MVTVTLPLHALQYCNVPFLDTIFSTLHTIPEIGKLVSEAFGGRHFSVLFTDPASLFSDGRCKFALKEIHIKKGLSPISSIMIYLFELCNAANSSKFPKMHRFRGSADEYALEMERVEFTSVTRYARLLEAFVGSGPVLGMLSAEDVEEYEIELAEYGKWVGNWDLYWYDVNRVRSNTCSHADNYRNKFNTRHS
jgi:hypothetical protein